MQGEEDEPAPGLRLLADHFLQRENGRILVADCDRGKCSTSNKSLKLVAFSRLIVQFGTGVSVAPKKQSTDHRIGPPCDGHLNEHMPIEIPNGIDSAIKIREIFGIDYSSRVGIENRDVFAPAGAVEIEAVKSDLVRLSICQVDVESEAGN